MIEERNCSVRALTWGAVGMLPKQRHQRVSAEARENLGTRGGLDSGSEAQEETYRGVPARRKAKIEQFSCNSRAVARIAGFGVGDCLQQHFHGCSRWIAGFVIKTHTKRVQITSQKCGNGIMKLIVRVYRSGLQ